MTNKNPSDSLQSQTSSQFNARLPQLTHNQINKLVADHGLTKTQIIIVAVDRLARDLGSVATEAESDIRRLKTTGRIAPQFDLDQDDELSIGNCCSRHPRYRRSIEWRKRD
jgi:hypothetical protein